MPPFAGHPGHRDEDARSFGHVNDRKHFVKEDHVAEYFKSLVV